MDFSLDLTISGPRRCGTSSMVEVLSTQNAALEKVQKVNKANLHKCSIATLKAYMQSSHTSKEFFSLVKAEYKNRMRKAANTASLS